MDPQLGRYLAEIFAPAPKLGLRGIFQFVFAGAAPTPWSVTVGDTKAEVAPGFAEAAAVTVTLTGTDLIALAEDTVSVGQLIVSGRVRVRGEASLVLQLPGLIDVARAGSTPEAVAGYRAACDFERRAAAPRRFSDELAERQPRLQAVDRRVDLGAAEFESNYRDHGRPVVLAEAAAHWPMSAMTFEDLRRFERLQVYTRNEGSYTDAPGGGLAVLSLSEMIDGLTDGAAPYAAHNVLADELRALVDPPQQFPAGAYLEPMLWLGPAGTASRWHRDHTDNMFVQVLGRKRFGLRSPGPADEMGVWRSVMGAELCEVAPRAKDVLHVTLEPGDALFLPEGWYHHVVATEPSLSVSYWTRSSRRTARDVERLTQVESTA